jgi:hypothetical protein
MKGPSEGKVREALEALAVDMPLLFYKPPDDARNWKPADFLVWWGVSAANMTWVLKGGESFEIPKPGRIEVMPAGASIEVLRTGAGSAFIEVKDNPNLRGYNTVDLRPVQRAWMRHAARIGVAYWLVMWWHKRHLWSVSDAAKVIHAIDSNPSTPTFPFSLFITEYGVDTDTAHLAGTLGAALRGEIG